MSAFREKYHSVVQQCVEVEDAYEIELRRISALLAAAQEEIKRLRIELEKVCEPCKHLEQQNEKYRLALEKIRDMTGYEPKSPHEYAKDALRDTTKGETK